MGTTASFSSLSKARVYYVLARPRYVCYMLYILYLNHPLCAISCRLLLYTPCLPPPRAIEGVRGIYPFNRHNTNKQAGYIVCALGIFCA